MAVAPTRHALIVGAGLAGPCLAICLARQNIRSTVFEIRPTRSSAGGSISLGPNAIQVLDRYAKVYTKLQPEGYEYFRFGAYTDHGEKLGDIISGDERPGGYPALRIMRNTLNKTLVEAGDEFGDMIKYVWGAKVSKIEETDKDVTAHFEDGSTAKGDFLVGADGVHSKVREHVLGSAAPKLRFEKLLIVFGFVPASSVVTPTPDLKFPAFMFTHSGIFMTIPIDAKGENLAWGINKSVSEERSRAELSELEKNGEAARMAKADYHDVTSEPVRSLLDKGDDSQTRVWQPYSIPDIPKWHTSRVCLIGDSAHALPPNGLGSALAFEDAAILTRILTSTSPKLSDLSYEQRFAQFEAIRRPRIKKLRDNESTSNAVKTRTGPLLWYAKKWAFRGFFWWKGGIMRHFDEGVGDVDEIDIEKGL